MEESVIMKMEIANVPQDGSEPIAMFHVHKDTTA